MTQLTIYPDDTAAKVLLDTSNGDEIAKALQEIGVIFERWDASVVLSADAGQEEVLAAYEPHISRLMRDGGYKSVDVIRVKPDHPDRVALRQKFFNEHTHDDDEVRFFVEGSGAFYLHKEGRVFRLVCERNDLISVPAGTTHWFDTGAAPHFCAIRIFMSPEGWIGHFTGSDIAQRFPTFGA